MPAPSSSDLSAATPLAGPPPQGGGNAGAAFKHEALLVRADRRADHLRRDVEKALVEGAHENDRPLDEAGDLFEEPLVLDEFETLGEGEVAWHRAG